MAKSRAAAVPREEIAPLQPEPWSAERSSELYRLDAWGEDFFFITADVRPLGLEQEDVEACRTLTVKAGVTAIPVSAFYGADAPKHFIRFCFSKKDEVLDAALERLAAYAGKRAARSA